MCARYFRLRFEYIPQEIDKQASGQVVALFAEIDASLYESVRHHDAEMEQECRDWANKCVYCRNYGVFMKDYYKKSLGTRFFVVAHFSVCDSRSFDEVVATEISAGFHTYASLARISILPQATTQCQ